MFAISQPPTGLSAMARLSIQCGGLLLASLVVVVISIRLSTCIVTAPANSRSSSGDDEGRHSLGSAEDGWSGFRTRLLSPNTYAGSRTGDYDWNFVPTIPARTWVEAKAGVDRGPGSYVVLGWTFPGEDFWGHRVRLQAGVSVSRDVSGNAYAALFVRVANARSGNTIVLDNMYSRQIKASRAPGAVHQYEVVVNVPNPFEGDSCPADQFISDVIHVGVVVCGGRGRVEVVDARFGSVHGGVPVTGGAGPWLGPPDEYDEWMLGQV